MSGAAQPQPQPVSPGRRSWWLLGVTGVVLLVVAIVMMASNAPESRAQTIHPNPHLAPAQLVRFEHQGGRSLNEQLPKYPGIVLVRYLLPPVLSIIQP